jgi:hypothetical protein
MTRGRHKLDVDIIKRVTELHLDSLSIRQIRNLVTYENKKGETKRISLGSICNIIKTLE